MKTRSMVLIFMCLLSLAAVSAAFLYPVSALAAVPASPVFEKQVGTGDSVEAGQLGEWIVEEEMPDYDKFYYPAAFCSDEKNGLIFVLDSAKNRICAYGLDGKDAGEIKVPYEFLPIDIAWSAKSGTIFVAFSDRPQIAVLNIETKNGIALRSHKLADLVGINDRAPGIQNIWLCASSKDKEDILLVYFNSCYDSKAAAFIYGGEKLLKLCAIDVKTGDIEMSYLAASNEEHSFYNFYMNGTVEAGIFTMDIKTKKTTKNILPGEFLPKESGMQCVACRPVGGDAAGNIYIEAHFSSGEISGNAYVYKFDKNMKQLGKTEVFTSPEMLSNRFIHVDASGSVYYMKLDIKNRKIQFYKFVI